MMNKIKKRFLTFLALFGPGLFLIGYNIGTGSVTTMAKTGADHGMGLLWVLALSSLFTYILFVAYGKATLVTGKTALYNIKNNFKHGWILALYIMIALIAGELLAVMGVMGIVADMLQEGILMTIGLKVNPFWIILVATSALFALLWYGRYRTFEKVLFGFVILLGLSFILVLILVKPDFGALAKGLIPGIPTHNLGLIAAIAGTTCSAVLFIMRSTIVAEKGWTIKDLKTEKKDSAMSAITMLILSAVIMAVSAGTLHVMGKTVENTTDMIYLFEPLGGRIAAIILILGVVGAGLSTIFPIALIAPWLIADYAGKPRNTQSTQSRILIFIALLFGFGSVLMEQRPPALMIFSQAFQACILPAVAIPILILLNRKSLMGAHVATLKENLWLWAVIAFSLYTTYYAIADFF
ncbi:MAG: Nramp family divalent metal transporter [Tannerella sp.]|jgi:Mn2+/Fe2+ NRAMP family transporter|nr:Nramp family divalent metal transporter [Tannerella sp.]